MNKNIIELKSNTKIPKNINDISDMFLNNGVLIPESAFTGKNQISEDVLSFFYRIRFDNIDGVKYYCVNTNKNDSRYVKINQSENKVLKYNKTGFINELKNIYESMGYKTVFSISDFLIDYLIESISYVTFDLTRDTGLLINKDGSKVYNHIVYTEMKLSIIKSIEGLERGDVRTIYNKNKYKFKHMDFLIDHMLNLEDPNNKPIGLPDDFCPKMHFISFCAFSVNKKEKAILSFFLYSGQGTGKTLYLDGHTDFHGSELSAVVNSDTFTSVHNDILENKLFIIGNEIKTFTVKDSELMGNNIKAFISDDYGIRRSMRKGQVNEREIFNCIFTGNKGDRAPFKIEKGDRRLVVLQNYKPLAPAVMEEFGLNISDFADLIKKERFEYFKTLMLCDVKPSDVKNTAYNNNTKNQMISLTNTETSKLRDIIYSNSREELDDYFYETIDTDEYKDLKMQIDCGFLTLDICNNYIYNNLRDLDAKEITSNKKNVFFDRIISVSTKAQYKDSDGKVKSNRIRKLPNYDSAKMKSYFMIGSTFDEYDDTKVEVMEAMNEITEDNGKTISENIISKSEERRMRAEIMLELKNKLINDPDLTLEDIMYDVPPF